MLTRFMRCECIKFFENYVIRKKSLSDIMITILFLSWTINFFFKKYIRQSARCFRIYLLNVLLLIKLPNEDIGKIKQTDNSFIRIHLSEVIFAIIFGWAAENSTNCFVVDSSSNERREPLSICPSSIIIRVPLIAKYFIDIQSTKISSTLQFYILVIPFDCQER